MTNLVAAPRSSPKHLEYDGGRPTKQEHAVHRRYWPKQSPALHRNYVAVAERRVVHESEIYWVSTKCGGRRNKIDVRPNWKEQPPSEGLTGRPEAKPRA